MQGVFVGRSVLRSRGGSMGETQLLVERFLVRHFVDHASGYLTTLAAGFATLSFAGRRAEWIFAIGWCIKTWFGLARSRGCAGVVGSCSSNQPIR